MAKKQLTRRHRALTVAAVEIRSANGMTTRLVRLWLWLSALATAAGWILSALGQLNRIGYLVFAAIAIIVLWLGRQSLGLDLRQSTSDWKKIGRRLRRPLAGAFAVLAVLVFVGGALYPPTNHTGLAYRLPRVLQWLAHDHWLWIHTPNYRMNDRACGIEWLTAPVML